VTSEVNSGQVARPVSPVSKRREFRSRKAWHLHVVMLARTESGSGQMRQGVESRDRSIAAFMFVLAAIDPQSLYS